MKLDGWKWIIGCTCANGYCWLPKGGCSVIVGKKSGGLGEGTPLLIVVIMYAH